MRIILHTFWGLYMLVSTCGKCHLSYIQMAIYVSVCIWWSPPTHIQVTICVTVYMKWNLSSIHSSKNWANKIYEQLIITLSIFLWIQQEKRSQEHKNGDDFRKYLSIYLAFWLQIKHQNSPTETISFSWTAWEYISGNYLCPSLPLAATCFFFLFASNKFKLSFLAIWHQCTRTFRKKYILFLPNILASWVITLAQFCALEMYYNRLWAI